jgi:predicted esterase
VLTKINIIFRVICFTFTFLSVVSCSHSKIIAQSASQLSLSSPPPLLPETLSNSGADYNGRTQITFLLNAPVNTPENSTIYLSGSHDDWSGGVEQYKFIRADGGSYKLVLEENAGAILQFKVTRGSWDSGEVDERGRRIANRVLYVRNKPLEIILNVHQWNDTSNETDNIDTDFWQTEIPNINDDASHPSLSLEGDRIVRVSSLTDYIEHGVVATSTGGVNILEQVVISGMPTSNDIGDYLITYNVSDSVGNRAIPISRLLRIVGEKPNYYSLRSVGSTSAHLGYIEQLPANYGKNSKVKYPLFIYHHGAGGEASSMGLSRNTSLFELSNWWGGGPARIAMRKHWNTKSPLIVLSPQRTFFEANIESIDAFVEYAIRNYQVDPNRIYMGGYSAGGFISWEYAIHYPEKVAAILPLSGSVFAKSLNKICNAKSVAVWAFHGVKDESVSVEKAKDSINAFNQCKPDIKGRLTLFDDLRHGSHQQVLELKGMFNYSTLAAPFNENIYTWLMKQTVTPDLK